MSDELHQRAGRGQDPAPAAAVEEAPGASTFKARTGSGRSLGPGFWLATGFLVVLVLLAALAPWLPFVQDPNKINADALRQGPSVSHWFGGDDGGRDVFARVVYGGRVSLFIGVTSIAMGLTVGGLLGLTTGYYRGAYERVVMATMDIMLAFPALVLALALVTFLSEPGQQGGSIWIVTLTLGILSVPPLARITRASTLTFAQREFVLAARAMGAKNRRILGREILPNVVPPMASFALLAIAVGIVVEGALSFLGLSVKAPQPTWGNLIAQGRQVLRDAPHIALFPSVAMFLTLVSLNYVGDALRSRFEIREANL